MFQAVARGVPSVGDLSWKAPVRVATVASLPANTRTGNVLTASANGALPSLDAIALAVGDRVLVKNEATGANNGVYTVTDLGSAGTPWVFTRAADADSATECVQGASVFVRAGARNIWKVFQAGNPWTLNATDPAFASMDMVLTVSGVALNRPSTLGQQGGLRLEADATATFPPRLTITRLGDTDSIAILDINGLYLGPGTVTMDTRLRRSAAKVLTMDDTTGGPLTLLDLLGAPVKGKAPLVTVFAAGGTWTPGAGILYAIVEVQAGGGGGGGSSATGATTWSAGAGGGGGGYGRRLIPAATLGASQVVTVGAGGLAGAVGALGGTGGTSSFGALLSATGGVGGQGDAGARATASVGSAGGTGGTSTLGDLATPGDDGEHGRGSASPDPRFGGYGGGSALAGQTLSSTTGAGANGNTGKSYGGGGSGATTALAAGAAHTGGAGGPGVVIVTEYFGP